MKENKSAKKVPMIRLYLYLIGLLILGAGIFTLCYTGGGANVLLQASAGDTPGGTPGVDGSPSPDASGQDASASPDASSAVTPSPKPSTQGRLIPFLSADGLWGYKNMKGEVVAAPAYEHALEFEGDVAFASQNGLYGLLSRDFTWIAQPAWSAVISFSENRAAVESGGKWGFIDVDGKLVIDYLFNEVGSFHCGRAIARVSSEYGYIDINGSFAISEKWAFATDFSDDVAFVRSSNGNSYIIDKVGEKIATLSSRQHGSPYADGFALIQEGDSYYFLNSRGSSAFETTYENALSFSCRRLPTRRSWGSMICWAKIRTEAKG
jgi:hypothetical protein